MNPEFRKERVLNQIHVELKEKNIKQSTLGEALDLKQSAVSSLLSGKSNLSFEQFLVICEVLGIRPQQLINKSEKSLAKKVQLTPEQASVLHKSDKHLLLFCSANTPVRPSDVAIEDITLEDAIDIFREFESVGLLKSISNDCYVQINPDIVLEQVDQMKSMICHKKVIQRSWNLWLKKYENKSYRSKRFNYFLLDLFTTSQIKEIDALLWKVYEKISEIRILNQGMKYQQEDMKLWNINLMLMTPLEDLE